jgi:hypothetical protein
MRKIGIAAFVGFSVFATAAITVDAHAQTVNSRLNRLEKKTDYFTKRSNIVRRSLSSKDIKQANGSNQCAEFLTIYIDPGVQLSSATIYTWATAKISYTNNTGNVGISYGPEEYGFPCGTAEETPDVPGTVQLKKFCSFDIEQGTRLRFTFLSGRGCVNESISNIDLQLKFTLIEIVEPKFN